MPLTTDDLNKLRRAPRKGNRVRVARKLLNLTQQQFADAVGLSQTQVSDLELSRYDDMRLSGAARLADFVGCSIEELFPNFTEAATR